MTPQQGASPATMSDADLFTLLLLAPLAIPIVIGVLAGRVDAVAEWLTEHHILVPADQALLAPPGLAGAGLDLTRVLIAALLVVGLVAWIVMVRAGRKAQQ